MAAVHLHKLWNAAKKVDPALAWWSKNSKCVYQEAFRNLDRALRDFVRSKHGIARILSVTLSRTAQRWSASFTVEMERNVPLRHSRPGTAIGVDLGVSTLLTGVDSDGNVVTVAGPRALRTALRRLRRASRAHSRKVRGSANRRRSAARLARIHARVANAHRCAE